MPIFIAAPSKNTVKIRSLCRFSVIFWSSDPDHKLYALSGAVFLESII
jgi:hypothetical protein